MGAVMSKSKGNTVEADTRLIEELRRGYREGLHPFPRPRRKKLEWSDQGIEGVHRFLGRVQRFIDPRMELLKNPRRR